MRPTTLALLLALLAATAGLAQPQLDHAERNEKPAQGPVSDVRFTAVDVLVDSGAAPLAAYQFEFTGTLAGGSVTLVGVEGGEPPAFAPAPYYDPKALAGNRVIVASFSTSGQAALPRGKARVARLHLRIEGVGEPEYTLNLTVAGDAASQPIQATSSIGVGP